MESALAASATRQAVARRLGNLRVTARINLIVRVQMSDPNDLAGVRSKVAVLFVTYRARCLMLTRCRATRMMGIGRCCHLAADRANDRRRTVAIIGTRCVRSDRAVLLAAQRTRRALAANGRAARVLLLCRNGNRATILAVYEP